MSGIKAHTLRVWEHRYGLMQLNREANTHRVYSNEDLRQLLQVAHLYKRGYRISRIAGMSESEIQAIIEKEIFDLPFYTDAISRLLNSSRMMDDESFAYTLKGLHLQLGVQTTVLHVVYPFLEKIGLLWMNGALLPAQEHFASYHIRNFLILAIDTLPPVKVKPDEGYILLMTPPEEYHEIPLLFLQYMLRQHGHATIMLGTNVSDEVLHEFCTHQKISIIHYHHITNFTHLSATEYLNHLALSFPRQRVVASGGLLPANHDAPPNAHVLGSIDAWLRYAKDPKGMLASSVD